MEAQRILVVEDNADDEMLTLRALRGLPFPVEIEVARNGSEALTQLNERRTTLPHLIVLDLKMPMIGGMDVLRTIRRDLEMEGLPVLILSSSDESDDVLSASLLSCSAYVRKEIDMEAYIANVQHEVSRLLSKRLSRLES
jgi:two-component system response regulator